MRVVIGGIVYDSSETPIMLVFDTDQEKDIFGMNRFVSAPTSTVEERQALIDSEITQSMGDKGKISDGYHTFNELYYHRMMLFAVICRQNRNRSWKSWKHEDGTMFDDYFIVGVVTKEGDYTYHYHKDHWELFKVPELEHAPKWDGHTPEDVSRLLYIKRRN